jgi:hypothetical protein
MAKKDIEAKLISVFNPENGDEFEVFVTYEFINDNLLEEDEEIYMYNYGFDIKSYVSSNNEDVPEWMTEEMVYHSLSEIINNSMIEDNMFYDDGDIDDIDEIEDYDDDLNFSESDDEDDW